MKKPATSGIRGGGGAWNARILSAALASIPISLGAVGCSSHESTDDAPEAVIAPDVYVLDQDVTDVVTVEKTDLRFPLVVAGALKDRKTGDVIVGRRARGNAAGNPQGFLRRISSMVTNGDEIVVGTDRVSLDQVIQQGHIGFTRPLYKPTLSPQDTGGVVAGQFDVSTTFLETGTAEISAEITKGTFSFNPMVDFHVDFGWSGVNDLRLGVDAPMKASLAARVSTTGAIQHSFEQDLLPRSAVFSATEWVGVVPVEETVNLTVSAGCQVSAEDKITVEGGASLDANLGAGVEYQNGQWSKHGPSIAPLKPIGPTVSATLSADARCYVTAEISVDVYDVAGPYFDTTLYGDDELSSNGSTLDWTLSAGVEGVFGGKAEIQAFGHDITLVDKSIKVYDLNKTLATGSAPLSSKCSGATSQACGNCGTQSRTCNNGTWSSWGSCSGQGQCAAGAVQACGTNGQETCDTSCHWGSCQGQTCLGATTQACGNCGTQSRTCKNGTWSSWGSCSGTGTCSPGSTQNCGSGGTQTCDGTCNWGTCGSQTCSGPSSQTCGNCGTQIRTCNNGTWSSWGQCSGGGVCSPNATQACGSGGSQTCDATCNWGTCNGQTCSGPSTQSCGNCGTQTRSCNSGAWSAWGACTGTGVCSPGTTQTCSGGTQTCSASCNWGSCTGGCSGSSTQSCGNCGYGTQSRTCNGGTWSSWGACVGGGTCSPGATQTCSGGNQICDASCNWGTCNSSCQDVYTMVGSSPACQACIGGGSYCLYMSQVSGSTWQWYVCGQSAFGDAKVVLRENGGSPWELDTAYPSAGATCSPARQVNLNFMPLYDGIHVVNFYAAVDSPSSCTGGGCECVGSYIAMKRECK